MGDLETGESFKRDYRVYHLTVVDIPGVRLHYDAYDPMKAFQNIMHGVGRV